MLVAPPTGDGDQKNPTFDDLLLKKKLTVCKMRDSVSHFIPNPESGFFRSSLFTEILKNPCASA